MSIGFPYALGGHGTCTDGKGGTWALSFDGRVPVLPTFAAPIGGVVGCAQNQPVPSIFVEGDIPVTMSFSAPVGLTLISNQVWSIVPPGVGLVSAGLVISVIHDAAGSQILGIVAGVDTHSSCSPSFGGTEDYNFNIFLS